MTKRPPIPIQQQTAFGEDGELKVTETSVETSLEDFGAEIDHRERTPRRDQPQASEFGVDDRPEIQQGSEHDQSKLFAATDEDQQTLAGDTARNRCLYDDNT